MQLTMRWCSLQWYIRYTGVVVHRGQSANIICCVVQTKIGYCETSMDQFTNICTTQEYGGITMIEYVSPTWKYEIDNKCIMCISDMVTLTMTLYSIQGWYSSMCTRVWCNLNKCNR